MHFIPSLLDVFLEWQQAQRNLEPSECGGGRLPSLARVFASGEVLAPSACRLWFSLFLHVGLYEMYGPTETTVDATALHCTARSVLGGTKKPLGVLISNV